MLLILFDREKSDRLPLPAAEAKGRVFQAPAPAIDRVTIPYYGAYQGTHPGRVFSNPQDFYRRGMDNGGSPMRRLFGDTERGGNRLRLLWDSMSRRIRPEAWQFPA